MKIVHVGYCIIIFFLIIYVGHKQNIFVTTTKEQSRILDSLFIELDTLKNYT